MMQTIIRFLRPHRPRRWWVAQCLVVGFGEQDGRDLQQPRHAERDDEEGHERIAADQTLTSTALSWRHPRQAVESRAYVRLRT